MKKYPNDSAYFKVLDIERNRKKKRQATCTHPDDKVSIICRHCLSHLEGKGYVARRKDVV
jgi:hypothetical protein